MFLAGLAVAAGEAQALRVRFHVLSTFGQRDDVVPDDGCEAFAESAQRIALEEFLSEALELPASDAIGRLAVLTFPAFA